MGAPTLDTTPPTGAPFASSVRFDEVFTMATWTFNCSGTIAGYLNTSTFNYLLRHIGYMQSPFESSNGHNKMMLGLRINGQLISTSNNLGYVAGGWHDYPIGAQLTNGIYFNTAENTPSFPWGTTGVGGTTYLSGLEDVDPGFWGAGPWVAGDNTIDIMFHLIRSDVNPIEGYVTDELLSMSGLGNRILHLGSVRFSYSDGATTTQVTLEPVNATLAYCPDIDTTLVADPDEQEEPPDPVNFSADTPAGGITEWVMVTFWQYYYDETLWLANGDSGDPITFDYDPVDWINPELAVVTLIIWDAHGFFHRYTATSAVVEAADPGETNFVWNQITTASDLLMYHMRPSTYLRDGSFISGGFFGGEASVSLLMKTIFIPKQVATGLRVLTIPYFYKGDGQIDDSLVTGSLRAQLVTPTLTVDSSSFALPDQFGDFNPGDGVLLEWIIPTLTTPGGFWLLLWFDGTTPGTGPDHDDSEVSVNFTVYSCINVSSTLIPLATTQGAWRRK